MVALYIGTTAWGVTQCFTQNGGVYCLFTFSLAFMATMWVVLDARHRNKPIVSIVQLLIILVWPIAVPIYLIATRGVRGVGWSILNFIGLVVALCVGFYSTFLLVYGPDAIWPAR